MPTNDEIVKRVIDSKAVDFTAIGNLVAELGPSLALENAGAHFVAVGRLHNWVICMLPPAAASELVGDIVRGELGQAVRQE
jgi:hypothetical protein